MSETQTRRLAAILAADVVGYSRLMGEDEAGTLAALRAILDEIVKPTLEAHNGRLVKLMGDGALAEFGSVVDAVTCAVAIQTAMTEREKDAPDDRRIQFRIGINLGDIIIEDDDIFGDGVNLAARLEGLADPGDICVSRTVADYVGVKASVEFQPMGPQKLKNIAEPVEAFRVVAKDAKPARKSLNSRRKIAIAAALVAIAVGGSTWFLNLRAPPEQPEPIRIDSIAVLPFDNISNDPEQEVFAEGITDDLITDLAKIRGLLVIARNSVNIYKDRAVDIRQIGLELGVAHVLEGSVRRSGDTIRINAQLVSTSDGGHIWSERFDGELQDYFVLQDEITGKIVARLAGLFRDSKDSNIVDVLQMRAFPLELSSEAKPHKVPNTEALEFYWKGHSALSRINMNNGGVVGEDAYVNLTRANELDPDNPRTLASLGWYNLMSFYSGLHLAMNGSAPLARDLAERSLAIERSGLALMLRAAVLFELDGRDDDAIALGREAIAMAPSELLVVQYQGAMLLRTGALDRAIEVLEKARQLDPYGLDGRPAMGLGLAYLLGGKAQDAETILRPLAAEDRAPVTTDDVYLIAAIAAQGRLDEARTLVEQHMVHCKAKSLTVYAWCSLFAARTQLRFSLKFRNDEIIEPLIASLRNAGFPEEPT